MSLSSITKRKRFPDDFSDDVVSILEKMSFTKGAGLKILGSMGLRSQLYAGDYDGYEIVEGMTPPQLASRFKEIVRSLLDTPLTYIGDIKSGSVEEWKVLSDEMKVVDGKVVGYNATDARRRLEGLKAAKVVDGKEFKEAMGMLKDSISPVEALALKKAIRFNIIRWTPAEVLRGKKRLVDGRIYTLEEAFQSPTITKMDVVSWVQNSRFTDFSVIYEFRLDGKVLNEGMTDIEQALRENILGLLAEGNYFKMAKRLFALAKYRNDGARLKGLSPLFNGDLGRIYMVYGDIGTLEYLLENESRLPYDRIEFEISQFKSRLSNVLLNDYLKKEEDVYRVIETLIDLPNRANSNAKMLKLLEKLGDELKAVLSRNARAYLIEKGLLPPPRDYVA